MTPWFVETVFWFVRFANHSHVGPSIQLTLAQSGVAATCIPRGRTIQSALSYDAKTLNKAATLERLRRQFASLVAVILDEISLIGA